MKETRQLVRHQVGGCLHVSVEVKPHIPVTLICVDTVKPRIAERAMQSCLDQATFDDVKLLTNDLSRKHAVAIPPINGVEGYSNFMIRELNKYVNTSHCLVVQWDGYVLNANAWRDEFLKFDYIGSPWQNFQMLGGNGGFTLRSKKLLQILANHPFGDNPHPEDNYICQRHGQELQTMGVKFCGPEFSGWFSYEGRVWDNNNWVSHHQEWNGQFGFHSFLTKLPMEVDRPLVYHHSGDWGDVIYSLATIKAMGEGVLWLSPDIRYPYPVPPHNVADDGWVHNIAGLINEQEYIWKVLHTPRMPYSVDYDLNAFRKFYARPGPENYRSIFQLHLDAFKASYPEEKPWLTVKDPIEIPGKPIVVNRTQRYHNDHVSIWPTLKEYEGKFVFIGSEPEYHLFQNYCLPMKDIPWYPTKNLLEVARVIAGCKAYIGNQSAPMAIAIGLGKNIVQEVWPGNANCLFKRRNILYVRNNAIQMPKEWIR